MFNEPRQTIVATKTKTNTAMKTLMVVTVALASFVAISAFGLIAADGVKGLLPPQITVSVSADTPRAQQITVPANGVDLLHLDFLVRSQKPITIGSLTYNLQTDIDKSNLFGFRLYSGSGALIGGPVSFNSYHQTVTFSGQLTIPPSTPFRLVLKADLGAAPAGRRIRASVNPTKNIIPINPPIGLKILPNTNLYGYVMTTKAPVGVLVISLNPLTPSGFATAGVDQEILRLNLTASGTDIYIRDLELVKSIGQGICLPTGTGAATLKSSDLSVTYATWPAGTAWLARPNFSINDAQGGIFTNELVIAAGETKTVRLFGDTTGCRVNEALQFKVTGGQDTISGVKWQPVNGGVVDSPTTKNLPILGGVLVY